MREPYKIFISSTYADLIKERDCVVKAISYIGLKCVSMENFGARSPKPIETCLEEVRDSDILVVIVNYRYGNVLDKSGISFTEAEYDEGCRYGKNFLVYFRKEPDPSQIQLKESKEGIIALKIFKEKLRKRHTVKEFRDEIDLFPQVKYDLGKIVANMEKEEQEDKILRLIKIYYDDKEKLPFMVEYNSNNGNCFEYNIFEHKKNEAKLSIINNDELVIDVYDYHLPLQRENDYSNVFRGVETGPFPDKEFCVGVISTKCDFGKDLFAGCIKLVKIAEHRALIIEYDVEKNIGIEYDVMNPNIKWDVCMELINNDNLIIKTGPYCLETKRVHGTNGFSYFHGYETGPEPDCEFIVYIISADRNRISRFL